MSNMPVAKRTRSQYEHHLQLLLQESKRRKRNQVVNISSVSVDEHQNQPNGSRSNNVDESSNDVERSRVPTMSKLKVEESNDLDEVSHDKSKHEEKNNVKDNFYESDPETSYVESSESDDSDSDYAVDKEVDEEKGSKGASRSATRKIYGAKTVDTSSSDEFEEENDHKNGSRVPSTSTEVEKSNDFDEFSLDESQDEESNDEESSLLLELCDGAEVIDMTRKRKGYGLASSKTKTQINLVDLSDDSEKGSKGSCRSTRRKFEMETTSENGSGGPSKSTLNLEKSINLDESSVIELSTDEESNGEDYDSASPIKTGTHTYFYYPSDDSDSDDKENIRDEPEDENVQKSCKDHESPSNPKAGSVQSTEDDEDESSSSSESQKSHLSLKETNGLEEIGNVKSAGTNNGSASPIKTKTGTHTYFDYQSDDPDRDNIRNEPEDEKVQKSCKDHHESPSNPKVGSFQPTEDKPFSSSESESDKVDNVVFSPLHKKRNRFSTKKQSPTKNMNLGDGSDDRKEKNHSGHKRKVKRKDKKTNDEPSAVNAIEKKNPKVKVRDGKKEKNHPGHKSHKKKKDRKPTDEPSDVEDYDKTNTNDKVGDGQKDDDVYLNDILDSIMGKERVQEKVGDGCLPLKFRFSDSEDEASSKESNDYDAKGLFEEMNFALDCEEIISFKTPTIKNQAKSETTHFDFCQSGDHRDIYFEEQTGMRCRLYGAVILESRYVIPKLANYARAKRSQRSYNFDEHQLGSCENLYFRDSDSNNRDVCKQTEGTVWELIPTNIRAHLYLHQQQGFEFLWKNLTGTIELSKLHKLGLRGSGCDGGGCIISHAPGTGKTLLTIVFMESFLKKFPKCCPVIIAPANMLLTWEAEFKKWKVGFSFLNLNSSEFLCKEMVNGGSRLSKSMIRAMKIKSWSNGGSVLGVSYNLYGKLAGNTNTNLEKMGNLLLNMPGLVVLDEGHTPRNQDSNIWNTLLNLKTKNRVILSGTPFQNNFRELFNILLLVRPETAEKIVHEFADMAQRRKRKKSSGISTSEDIEKLKKNISPFVHHVHEGDILKNKLPGLKQIVVLLNPSPFQKHFIDDLGNSTNTFEYEHKVALVSVHPSLLSKKEGKSTNRKELEQGRLNPELGVKTRFVMKVVRLSVSLQEKVLIFSQYIQPLELLEDQIAFTFGWGVGREIMVINGTTHQTLRQTIINDFNDPNSKVKVLLASTKCCSEGIHLYGASRVLLLDVVWNPAVEKQAISRAYRIGQKKVVYTYHLMTAGTTEEDKYNRQVEKGWLAEKVFSSRVMVGEEPMKKANVAGIELDDKVLEKMVDHQELKEMFKKITCVEIQT